jgi:glyoxylase-like metal-dependent hydrolase (beta-lactamase superfamily II)
MDLRIDVLTLGPLETNCVVIRVGGVCAVADPGLGAGELMAMLRRERAEVSMVLLTHGHGDHIAGIPELREAHKGARIYCPAGDAAMLTSAQANLSMLFGLPLAVPPADVLVSGGDVIEVGPSRWEVLDTSGHTPGGVSYYCRQGGVVITGDALFAGGIGRTDLPGASTDTLLDNIRRNLLALPDQTKIIPGHGPQSTIGHERRTNPFL